MAGIVEYPHVVRQALQDYGDLFANEPQRRHFAEYLTGLFVAERKNVAAIHREFAQATDQSCLNRFLTEVDGDVAALNERRLGRLQQDPDTRYSDRGALPIDNTLIDHHGRCIADVAWFWDHAEDRYTVAHDYLILNYVCTSGKHYPLEFRRFQTEDLCFCLEQPYQNHTALCRGLIDWACERDIPGTFTFDSYFTNAEVLNHIHGKKAADGRPRGYVGSLKFNRKLQYRGRTVKASELAAEVAPADRKPMRVGERQQWYFTRTLRVPAVGHKVRVVILWQGREDNQPRIILVTDRTHWEVTRVVRVYGYRWTGTETFHRDGKQQLGLGDCQLRTGEGQDRHLYLVMLAYSLLMSQLRQGRAREWASEWLTTIGEACRAVLRETLRTTVTWAIEHARDKLWDTERVIAHLNLA